MREGESWAEKGFEGFYIARQIDSAERSEEKPQTIFLKIRERRIEMNGNFVPERYGMVICPLCGGKGFWVKQSGMINVTLRRVCAKCGGFGAVKKEEEVSRSPRN